MATSDLSFTNSAPPSSLAQSWQYWRWSCWAHYSPNRLRCSAPLLRSDICSQDPMIQPNPTQSQEFSVLKPQCDSMWLNVTQRDSKFKGEITSLHPVFSDKHLHPRLHCIEGSLPAMALALRLWTWEIRKWVSQTLQIMLQPMYKHFSLQCFHQLQPFTACHSMLQRCVWALHVEYGIPQRWARPKLGTHRLRQQTKRVSPMAWHSGTAGTSIQLSKISILVKFCYHLHIYIYTYILISCSYHVHIMLIWLDKTSYVLIHGTIHCLLSMQLDCQRSPLLASQTQHRCLNGFSFAVCRCAVRVSRL